MGKDDYSSAVVGGGLKLKGVKSGGIEKKKKKKHSSKSKEKVEGAAVKDHVEGNSKHNEDGEETNEEKKLPRNSESQSEEQSYVPRRTEAEQRFEEMRRKRVGFVVSKMSLFRPY